MGHAKPQQYTLLLCLQCDLHFLAIAICVPWFQEVNFGVLESSGGGILEAFENLLSSVFIPALRRQTDWGSLSVDTKGQQMKTEFLTKLSSFVSVLANAQASISDVVELTTLEGIDTRNFTTPAQIMGAAGNSELMELVEKTVQQWCAEIEQVGTHVTCLQLLNDVICIVSTAKVIF